MSGKIIIIFVIFCNHCLNSYWNSLYVQHQAKLIAIVKETRDMVPTLRELNLL